MVLCYFQLLCLLRLRAQELAAPRLVVSEFDVERNDEAKKAYKERVSDFFWLGSIFLIR